MAMGLRKAFTHLSLRTQITLVFGSMVVSLSVLLSLGFGELLKARIQKDAQASLRVVADNAARLLAAGLSERSREVQVLASSEVIWSKGLDTPEVIHLLARSQAMQPHSAWIGVADMSGVVRAATGNLLVGQSVLGRPWFTAGRQQLHVGDVHPAKLLASLLPGNAPGESMRFLDFAAPIRIGPTTVGVLAIHGSWEWTRELMQGLIPMDAQTTGLELFIFDHQGLLIHGPDDKTAAMRADRQRLPTSPRPGVAGQGDTDAQALRWHDGQTYLTAIAPLKPQSEETNLGWSIVARQPLESAFAEAENTVQKALFIGLLAAAWASGLAWWAARKLVDDLYALARAAQNVDAGLHGTAIPPTASSVETRQLAAALHRMTRRLLDSKEAMEETVQQRTAGLEAANRALDLQARSDALTGLLNRRGFDSQLGFALALARRSGRPLSVITVDVDHFKRINDTFGHAAGDQVLQRLARLLLQQLRDSDVVARTGGEEFVVLLPDTDLANAQVTAQLLVDTMAERNDPVVGRITMSAGVSALRNALENGADMLHRSDAALYEAKGQGRNRVCAQA